MTAKQRIIEQLNYWKILKWRPLVWLMKHKVLVFKSLPVFLLCTMWQWKFNYQIEQSKNNDTLGSSQQFWIGSFQHFSRGSSQHFSWGTLTHFNSGLVARYWTLKDWRRRVIMISLCNNLPKIAIKEAKNWPYKFKVKDYIPRPHWLFNKPKNNKIKRDLLIKC